MSSRKCAKTVVIIDGQKKGIISLNINVDLLYCFFSYLDTTNGIINLNEMKLCVKFLGYSFKNEEEAVTVFQSMDINSDGKVIEEEFLKWWDEENKSGFRLKLDRYSVTADKLGRGADNSGAAFG